MAIPNVIIELHSGLVSGIVADGKVRCVVVDHDTDGMDDDTMRQFPVSKGHTESVGATDWSVVDLSADFVKRAIKRLGF